MARTWTPAEISETMRSYQPSCVLLAACELEIFDIIQNEPLTAAAIAKSLQLDLRGVTTLLDALVSMGVLIKSAGQFSPAPGVASVLTSSGKQSMLAMAQHQANCLRAWADLARIVKTGRPHRKEPSVRGEAADYAAFIEAMDNISRLTAQSLVDSLPALTFSHLLDVGGASGTWAIAFLNRYPRTKATLFDLPKVMPQAATRIAAADMMDRVRLVGGDFMADPLPHGADLAWVSAIIHQMSREDGRRLYASVLQALKPGGRILIRDHVMDDERTQPSSGALFAINMLANTDAGGTFTFHEIAADLKAAGFVSPELLHREDTMNSVVAASKPE